MTKAVGDWCPPVLYFSLEGSSEICTKRKPWLRNVSFLRMLKIYIFRNSTLDTEKIIQLTNERYGLTSVIPSIVDFMCHFLNN